MAFSVSLDNIKIGSDKIPSYGEKTNKNCTALAYAVEDIYNKYSLDIATKSIGYSTPINLVNSKVLTITVPSTGYNSEGISFKQSGTGTELASIKVNGTGSIDAVLGNLTVTSLTLSGAVTGTKLILTSTTDTSTIPYLTSSNIVASGGVKVGYDASVGLAITQGTNSAPISNSLFDKSLPGKKIYTITGSGSTAPLDIILPAFNSKNLDGYEFSIVVIPNATQANQPVRLNTADSGAVFVNSGSSAYQIAPSFTSGKGITFNFKVVNFNNNANSIWVTSVLA